MLDIGACCSQLSIPDIKLGWPAIFLAAVPLLSLATNGCMCAAIGHMKPPHKGGVSWLILSITVCDIVASATLMPLSVAKAHLGKKHTQRRFNNNNKNINQLWLYIHAPLSA